MKMLTILSLVMLTALPAATQDFEIDTNTAEGRLLQQIGMEEAAQQKAALLEQFAKEYPKHNAIGWIYAQMPAVYVELNQSDKALAAGEKMLEIKPTDAAGAHGCLKIAEALKDPDLIRTWAINTHEAAQKAVAAQKPDFEYEDEEVAWKEAIEFAKQVDTYSEYALYAGALQAADASKVVAMAEALKQVNPEGQYVAQLRSHLFRAYLQLGDMENAVAVAEESLVTDPSNEDMLLVVADTCFTQEKEPEKVLSYSARLIEVMNAKSAPEGVSPEAWEQKKTNTLGRAYWMTGIVHSNQRKYSEANKVLRQALPHIKGNEPMLAAALFHLGVANFQMGDTSGNQSLIQAGFNYTKQCAAIKSTFQAQAQKNVKAMQSKYRVK